MFILKAYVMIMTAKFIIYVLLMIGYRCYILLSKARVQNWAILGDAGLALCPRPREIQSAILILNFL